MNEVALAAGLTLSVPLARTSPAFVSPMIDPPMLKVGGGMTVRTVEPVTPDCEALMLVVPPLRAVAKPLELIVAVAGVPESQVTVLVMS